MFFLIGFLIICTFFPKIRLCVEVDVKNLKVKGNIESEKGVTEILSGPIEDFDFGYIVVNGTTHSDKGEGEGFDIVIYGEEPKVIEWKERDMYDWKKGTGHKFCIEMAKGPINMIREDEGYDIKFLLIGNGKRGALRVPKKVLGEIKKKLRIELVRSMKTENAIKLYNKLYNSGKAAGTVFLAHARC